MRIHKEVKSSTEITLTVTAEEKDLLPIKKAVLTKLSQSSKVGGFRPGKAPLALVEKNANQEVLQSEFLDQALNQLYSLAVKAEKLNPVAPPKATLQKFVPFTMLEFSAELEVIGEVKLPDYTKLKLARNPAVVTSEDIQAVIKRLQTQLADKKDANRAAKNGDQVWIDFAGFDTGDKPISGADGKDYPLILGSNTFIPGFEPKIVGLKGGEKTEFNLTFPKDYGVSALQGKKVHFKVDVIKVQEVIESKVDDAFAAKVGPFGTVKELKDDIKKQLTAEQNDKVQQAFENELLRQIASKSTVDVPKSLVDEQIELMERDERQNLMYRGQTWEEHLQEEGVTDEEHKERNRPAAEERVKISLILSEIAERENIEITEQDLEFRMQLLKGQYKDASMQSELAKPNARQTIANRLAAEKTIAKLVDYTNKNTPVKPVN